MKLYINRNFPFIEHLGEGLTNTWEIIVYMIVLAVRGLDRVLLGDLEGWRDGGVNIWPGSCVMSSSNISHMYPSIITLISHRRGRGIPSIRIQTSQKEVIASSGEP